MYRIYFLDAVVEVTGAIQSLQSTTEQFAQGLAHSLQLNALWAHRIQNSGTVGVVAHQCRSVAIQRIGAIQINLN